MATKKKSKKAMKSRRTSGKKPKARKSTQKKQASTKRIRKKKGKTSSSKSKGSSLRSGPKATPEATRVYTHKEGATSEPERAGLRAGGQSGDLEGLRDVEGADSESVEELLEEGNAFEADAVLGVEDAENEEGREVHTHEVPEDDVPEEYEDKDS